MADAVDGQHRVVGEQAQRVEEREVDGLDRLPLEA
jgi:hypothetical protein